MNIKAMARNNTPGKWDETSVYPEPPSGLCYWDREIKDRDTGRVQQYRTTGAFLPTATDLTDASLVWCGTYSGDFDAADWIAFGREISKAEAKTWLRSLSTKDRHKVLAKYTKLVLSVLRKVIGEDPTVLVLSGYGLHVHYWLDKVEDGYRHDALRDLWGRAVQAINREAGFHLADPAVCDAGTRILREEGTRNRKGLAEIVVSVLKRNSTTVSLDALLGRLPEVATSVPPQGKRVPGARAPGNNPNRTRETFDPSNVAVEFGDGSSLAWADAVQAALNSPRGLIPCRSPFRQDKGPGCFLSSRGFLHDPSVQTTYWPDEWTPAKTTTSSKPIMAIPKVDVRAAWEAADPEFLARYEAKWGRIRPNGRPAYDSTPEGQHALWLENLDRQIASQERAKKALEAFETKRQMLRPLQQRIDVKRAEAEALHPDVVVGAEEAIAFSKAILPIVRRKLRGEGLVAKTSSPNRCGVALGMQHADSGHILSGRVACGKLSCPTCGPRVIARKIAAACAMPIEDRKTGQVGAASEDRQVFVYRLQVGE